MAHLTGLFKRGSAFYLRIVLPYGHPLHARYRNGRFVKSLGACSHREAVHKGLLKRAEVLFGFQHTHPQPGPAQATSSSEPASHQIPASSSPAPTLPVQPKLTLRAVYEKWKGSKTPTDDSTEACLRAVKLFEECLGKHTDMDTLTRAQGDTFP